MRWLTLRFILPILEMADASGDRSIEELFAEVQRRENVITASECVIDDTFVTEAIQMGCQCKNRVSGEGIFSKSEELDEISTRSVKVSLLI